MVERVFRGVYIGSGLAYACEGSGRCEGGEATPKERSKSVLSARIGVTRHIINSQRNTPLVLSFLPLSFYFFIFHFLTSFYFLFFVRKLYLCFRLYWMVGCLSLFLSLFSYF